MRDTKPCTLCDRVRWADEMVVFVRDGKTMRFCATDTFYPRKTCWTKFVKKQGYGSVRD